MLDLAVRLLILMVRRRESAVSNHEGPLARGPSFETPALQAPQDEVADLLKQ
jgi:hypothetical protein